LTLPKKPSQWTYSNSTPLVPHQLPTSTPAVPLGREREGIGKELEVKSCRGQRKGLTATALKEVFYSFKTDERYREIDFNNELNKLIEKHNGKVPIKDRELICHRWLDSALEYRNNRGGIGNGQHKSWLND
jgi:hypothetical protein